MFFGKIVRIFFKLIDNFLKLKAFVFLLFWFQLYCGFSGAVMINDMYLMIFNFVFTSLPPLAIGVYDKKLADDVLLRNPRLYRYVSYEMTVFMEFSF
jgi:phospholipid-translocating ATPase